LNYQSNLNLVENQISKNKFIFDEHTLPQFLSLQKNYISNCNIQLIKFDKNLSKKISSIVNENTLFPHYNPHYNKTKRNFNFCQELFEKYCEKNIKFYELYKKDFELYNISM
jgi:hypothetical protein